MNRPKQAYLAALLGAWALGALLLPVRLVLAQSPLNSEIVGKIADQDAALAQTAGFQVNYNVGDVMKLVIQGFLGLLGIIFLVLIIVAGFNWMTAGGDEAKVGKAKETIQRSVVGLIVIVSSYGITYFVFKALDNLVQ